MVNLTTTKRERSLLTVSLKLFRMECEEKLLFFLLNYFIGMGVLAACLSVHHMRSWYPGRPEEGVGSSGTGVNRLCWEAPCGRWESNPSSLKEQPALLTLHHLPSHSRPPPPFFVFETGSHYVALAGLELAMQIRLPLNSEVHLLLPPE